MNVVSRFNLFEKEQWAKLCIESESRRTIETLKNPNRKMVCLLAPDCFLFKVHNDDTSTKPSASVHRSKYRQEKQSVRDLVTSRGLLLQAKTTSSFVFSYRPAKRISAFSAERKFHSLKTLQSDLKCTLLLLDLAAGF
jgi:sugar diacid utilization regulator